MTSKARITNRLALSIGLAALILSFAAQAAFALDGRSPDTREAAMGTAVAVMDARSPDTRAIAEPSGSSIASDARDAASRAVPTDAPSPRRLPRRARASTGATSGSACLQASEPS